MTIVRSKYFTLLFASFVLALTWGCSPFQIGDSEDARSSADREGSECDDGHVPFLPLDESEVWFISTRLLGPEADTQLMIFGVGETAGGVILELDLFLGSGYASFGDDITFSITDTSISLEATLEDYEAGGPSSLTLTGTIGSCGHDTLGLLVFDIAGEATGTIAGAPFSVDGLQLLRIPFPESPPCDNPPVSLEGLEWSLSNADPASILGLGSPNEPLVELSQGHAGRGL